MRKTAASVMMLAGLGGCVSSPDGPDKPRKFGVPYTGKAVPGVVGPTGEPVMMTKAAKPATAKKADPKAKADPGVVPVGYAEPAADAAVTPAAGFARVVSHDGCATGDCGGSKAHLPGVFHRGGGVGHGGPGFGGYGAPSFGGILPAPGMGPAGAVAAVGAIGPGMGLGMAPMYANMRTAIRFVSPGGMQVTWQGPAGFTDATLTAPVAYNFPQNAVYRLKISGIPTQRGRVYYPTLEIAPATPKTVTFLSHGTVPVSFTDDDFAQVNAGNMVVKVIYLPDPLFQDIAALGGAEELVSTRLEPGVDPVAEALRRGTILAVIRMGNIDLQNPNTPDMTAPAMGGMPAPGGVPAPGMVPGPGMMPGPMVAPPAVIPGGIPPAALPAKAASGTAGMALPKAPATLPPMRATPTAGRR